VDARDVAYVKHPRRVVEVDVVGAEELVDEAVGRERGEVGLGDDVLEAWGEGAEYPGRTD
jgi:hypothetical protein